MQPEIPDLVKPSAYLLLYHASFVRHKRLLTKAHCCHRPPWRVIDSEEVEMFLEFKFCRLLRCSAPGCLLQTSPPDMEKWWNTLSCNFFQYDILLASNQLSRVWFEKWCDILFCKMFCDSILYLIKYENLIKIMQNRYCIAAPLLATCFKPAQQSLLSKSVMIFHLANYFVMWYFILQNICDKMSYIWKHLWNNILSC